LSAVDETLEGLDAYLGSQDFLQLGELDEDALLTELGKRRALVKINPALTGETSSGAFEAEELMSLKDFKALGSEFLAEWSKNAWELVCGQEKADTDDRRQILKAFSIGDRAGIAAAMTAALVAFGLGYAFAAPLAWFILRVCLQPGYEATCTVWQKHLPA